MRLICEHAWDAFTELVAETLTVWLQGNFEELFGYARIHQVHIALSSVPWTVTHVLYICHEIIGFGQFFAGSHFSCDIFRPPFVTANLTTDI